MDYTVIKYNKNRINYGIGFKQLKSGDDYTQMLYCAYYYAVSDHNYSYSIIREGVRIGLILIDNLNPRHLAVMDNKEIISIIKKTRQERLWSEFINVVNKKNPAQ